jgi:hypothetical protein
MKCLLLGGAPSVGKSETIYRITQFLRTKGFNTRRGFVPAAFSDFYAVIEKPNDNGNPTRIIINTLTETRSFIYNFKYFFDTNGTYDLLISSVMDDSFLQRKEFFSIMCLNPTTDTIIEIPLGKITRRDDNFNIALDWYQETMYKLLQHILQISPFQLYW